MKFPQLLTRFSMGTSIRGGLGSGVLSEDHSTTESNPTFGGVAWAGLAAADAGVAVEFCCAAFDWEPSPSAGFTLLRRAGEDVALVYSQTPQARAADVATHWTPFFLVDDVPAAVKRVIEAGGRPLRDPFDLAEVSVGPVQDALGAPLSLLAPRAEGLVAARATGAWALELATFDVSASREFYAHVLGWTYPDAADDMTILGPDGPLGRMRTTNAPSDWRACLRVPDLDDALRRAEAAGATPFRDSSVGDRAAIVDPQGATLFLQPDDSQRSGS
jgi:predicted enzyme related to lactoylglutathione lyase